MQEKEMQKAKRFNNIAFGVVCACVIAAAGFLFWLCNWPIDPALETAQLEQAVSGASLALAGESCYELENGEGLMSLCQFDSWTQVEQPGEAKHILTLKLAEEYELAFYEGGYVQAYFGYSRRFHLDTVWYAVPGDLAGAVADYVTANGTIRETALGPGSLFAIDE